MLCAGSLDTFQVFVWSVKTGRLLEALAAHEGPVTSLSFSPVGPLLATASWDHTVRTWDIFRSVMLLAVPSESYRVLQPCLHRSVISGVLAVMWYSCRWFHVHSYFTDVAEGKTATFQPRISLHRLAMALIAVLCCSTNDLIVLWLRQWQRGCGISGAPT